MSWTGWKEEDYRIIMEGSVNERVGSKSSEGDLALEVMGFLVSLRIFITSKVEQ